MKDLSPLLNLSSEANTETEGREVGACVLESTSLKLCIQLVMSATPEGMQRTSLRGPPWGRGENKSGSSQRELVLLGIRTVLS